jgi:hypothetical protein
MGNPDSVESKPSLSLNFDPSLGVFYEFSNDKSINSH